MSDKTTYVQISKVYYKNLLWYVSSLDPWWPQEGRLSNRQPWAVLWPAEHSQCVSAIYRNISFLNYCGIIMLSNFVCQLSIVIFMLTTGFDYTTDDLWLILGRCSTQIWAVCVFKGLLIKHCTVMDFWICLIGLSSLSSSSVSTETKPYYSTSTCWNVPVLQF